MVLCGTVSTNEEKWMQPRILLETALMLSLFNDFNIIKDVPSSTCGIFNLGANSLIGTREVDEGNVKNCSKILRSKVAVV
jgi:hypothetical protein